MDRPSKWEYYLYLVEFAYNNGFHAFLKMSPFEALYWTGNAQGYGRADGKDQTKFKDST